MMKWLVPLVVPLLLFAQEPKKVEPKKIPADQSYTITGGNKVFLPRLLTTDFYKFADVVENAKDQKKKFALVAIKSHACDCYDKCNYCLEETRAISDPANTFLFDNFARYHIRLTRHEKLQNFAPKKELDLKGLEILPGVRAVLKEWDTVGLAVGDPPGLLIVDTHSKISKAIGFIDMEKIPITNDRTKRAEEINKMIKDAIKDQKPRQLSDALRTLLNDTSKAIDENVAKVNPDPSLKEFTQVLDLQLENEDPAGKKFLENAGKNEK